MHYWIGLGSNLGDSAALIRDAIQLIGEDPALQVVRVSPLFRSLPWGDPAQPEFFNTAAELTGTLAPLELLGRLQAIEEALGRQRTGRRWGPRSIDLDILLVEDRLIHWPQLRVPHPRMHRRRFVLEPLAALNPDLEIPGRGRVRTLLENLPDQGVRRVTAESQL